MTLDNILADGPIAALHFRTGGGTSRGARAFIAELTALLSSTGRKPLIYATDHELTAIFRYFQSAELRNDRGLRLNFSGGERFADIEGYEGSIYIDTQYGDSRSCNISIPEGGKWLADRSPENTERHSLPVFDSERVSSAVMALWDRWSDKLVSTATAAASPRKSWVDIEYGGTDISTDPVDWDPTDPRRRDSAFIEKVRRLRRKVFGRDSREAIEGPQAHAEE